MFVKVPVNNALLSNVPALVTFAVISAFAVRLPLFSTLPWVIALFTVIVPCVFKVPLPVIVPRSFVPFTVKLAVFAIVP